MFETKAQLSLILRHKMISYMHSKHSFSAALYLVVFAKARITNTVG